MLFHFSEDGTIGRFEPRLRPSDPSKPPVVWAIDAEHAPHYFFPRDCPRVCFWPNSASTPDDVARFLGLTAARKVIAIESGWLERVRRCRLFAYRVPADTFVLEDAPAGYFVSTVAVTPLSVEPVGDLLERLAESGVELRITPSLWPLHDALVTATLDFSMIRLRNAAPLAETVAPSPTSGGHARRDVHPDVGDRGN